MTNTKTPSPETQPIGFMDVDGLRTLVGEVRARPAICPSPQDHLHVATPELAGIELAGVTEQLEQGAGAWRACSGCHELIEGHPTGPWSETLKSYMGGGCRECGGIGAIWDNTDYSQVNDPVPMTKLSATDIEELRSVDEFRATLLAIAETEHRSERAGIIREAADLIRDLSRGRGGKTPQPKSGDWTPPPASERVEGFECLAFIPVRWERSFANPQTFQWGVIDYYLQIEATAKGWAPLPSTTPAETNPDDRP